MGGPGPAAEPRGLGAGDAGEHARGLDALAERREVVEAPFLAASITYIYTRAATEPSWLPASRHVPRHAQCLGCTRGGSSVRL